MRSRRQIEREGRVDGRHRPQRLPPLVLDRGQLQLESPPRNTITWLPTKMIAPSRSFNVDSTASPSTTVPLVLDRSVISNVPSSGAGAIARCWLDTIRSDSTSDIPPAFGL